MKKNLKKEVVNYDALVKLVPNLYAHIYNSVLKEIKNKDKDMAQIYFNDLKEVLRIAKNHDFYSFEYKKKVDGLEEKINEMPEPTFNRDNTLNGNSKQ